MEPCIDLGITALSQVGCGHISAEAAPGVRLGYMQCGGSGVENPMPGRVTDFSCFFKLGWNSISSRGGEFWKVSGFVLRFFFVYPILVAGGNSRFRKQLSNSKDDKSWESGYEKWVFLWRWRRGSHIECQTMPTSACGASPGTLLTCFIGCFWRG